jgi:spoIIIJ-associated protein
MDRVTVEIEASEEDEVKTMRSAEGRGRTLDEAVDAALIELGESRRNVDVKVLSEGSEETVVEVTVIEQATSGMPAAPADGKGEMARTLVEGLLKHMGIRAQVTTRQGSEPTTLDISGRDLGALIGWRGETLRALQSVTNVMVGRHLGEGERIIVDVERYRQRREHTVREIALRAARQVKMTGDAITLDAMQPFERRAIHLALEGDPEVTSSSIGEEPERRVVVGLRKSGAE